MSVSCPSKLLGVSNHIRCSFLNYLISDKRKELSPKGIESAALLNIKKKIKDGSIE